MEEEKTHWSSAAVFGASGGIGSALCRALAERGVAKIYAGSRREIEWSDSRIERFTFDLLNEGSLLAATERMAPHPPELVLVATGALTLPDGSGPERSYRHLGGDVMLEALAINAVGPALIAKHMLPLLPREQRSAFVALSARVGSISDNRLGGWHSYRSSKAALNMLIRTFAIEIGRTHSGAVVAGLHPGTVDTALSAPFQANLPEGQLASPEEAARNLLRVIDGLTPADSGGVFDWRGEAVPP